MELKEFSKGQKVWVKCIGNAARGKKGETLIQEWEVVKVGKKYVHAKPAESQWTPLVFEIREYAGKTRLVEKTTYAPNYLLYTTRKEIEDEIEAENTCRKLVQFFHQYPERNLTIEQIREIEKIVFGKKKS